VEIAKNSLLPAYLILVSTIDNLTQIYPFLVNTEQNIYKWYEPS